MTTSAPAIRDEIFERAADFFERRHFSGWSDADQTALEAWFAESVLHEVAYLRLEGAVAHTQELAAIRPFEPPRTFGRHAERENRKHKSKWLVLSLLAASFALIAAVTVPILNMLGRSPDRTYSTEVGGRTLLKFADGTIADLNTNTIVRFHMTSTRRVVWLEKGEVWFHVAHNAKNPFSVVVGKHVVTDLGTEFLVRRDARDMEVMLFNGRADLNSEGSPAAMLVPGDDAVATPDSMSVTKRNAQELADALAWRRGVLVFRSTKLIDAVREVNRYNQVKIVIADPAIADLKFSGEIKSDNLEDFLALAQTMMQLRVDREGPSILLSRETPSKSKRPAQPRRAP